MAADQKPSRLWRILDGVMLVMFVMSIVVQFNDPDPALWITIYLLAAIVTFMSLRNSLPWQGGAAVAAIALIWAATLAPSVIGKVRFLDMFGAFEMKNEGIELSREMYGLLLIAVWTGFAAFRARRRQSLN
jgi:hypothetical protein